SLVLGPPDDVVVDVGHVRDVADVVAEPLEVAAQHVEDECQPAVADVGTVVDGRAADVHRDPPRLALVEIGDDSQCGVVQSDHPGTVTVRWRPTSPRNRASTGSKPSGSSGGGSAPTAST